MGRVDDYAELAQKLKPYISRWGLGNDTSAGTGASSGLVSHPLNSGWHTGQLAQSQAPWAVTDDEFLVHTSNPDAHHAKVHAITDAANHSVTGSQYQIVGLTAVNTLGLLTPSSSPAANAVVKTDGSSGVTLVDLTVTSDLFMSGYLDFGTDVMYEDASYLQVTGSKAVRFGQNIGNANWTVFNTGGAQFGGSVDIVGGGDLTVGSNVFFVDVSQESVGVNCAPDPQFAVDVNGPLRATYLIGPHAIQLSDVLLLCHYDGREKATQGEYNGHMGQVAAYSGGIAVLPGKFGKAVVSAPAANNYVPNPSFETGTGSWTAANGLTATRTTEMAYVGDYSLKCVASAANQGVYIDITGLTNGLNYNISGYVWVRSGTGALIQPYDAGGFSNGSTGAAVATRGRWVRFSVSRTVTSGGMRIWIRDNSGASTWYLDAVQVTATGYLQPYLDGSMGNGAFLDYTWSGTAHASTSYRYESRLSYDNANMPALDGTGSISAWAWTDGNTAADRIIFERYSGAGDIALFVNTSGNLQTNFCGVTVTGGAFTERQWNFVCVTWDGTNVKLFLNGVQTGSTTAYTHAISTATTINVGCTANSPYRQLNGLIDDFCITGQALTADLIRSIFESGAPVFAEFSRYNFRLTPKGLVWGDDEGLWMRDTTGNPVLGVYGGEAATKSWAGFTMAAGDLVLGRNAVGSSAIWWDQSSGKFGFYGAGSGTPQVEIATDGRLTAGAGKVALDSTGFKAYNASAVEAININADGIYMGDGGARTTIASWTSGGRVQFYSVGEIYEATPEAYLDDSSVSRTLYPLVVRGIRQGNDAALIELAAVRSDTGAGAKIIIGEGFRLKGYFSGAGNSYATNRVVHAIADDVILESTNLQLLGQTTSTGAVGTYAGKIKIRIAGTDRYIPYYAS